MTDDLVKRLRRDLASGLSASIGDTKDAADRIEELQAALYDMMQLLPSFEWHFLKPETRAAWRGRSMRNEARNFEIIDLWNAGLAARDIVRRMGVTKNVIIGVVNRNRDYITRPIVYCNSEKGRMSAMVRWGFKRKRVR
jgi:hypothetical protein